MNIANFRYVLWNDAYTQITTFDIPMQFFVWRLITVALSFGGFGALQLGKAKHRQQACRFCVLQLLASRKIKTLIILKELVISRKGGRVLVHYFLGNLDQQFENEDRIFRGSSYLT